MKTTNTTPSSAKSPLLKLQNPPKVLSYYGFGSVGLEWVEVLAGLGLAERQSRVYLSLLRTGDARARTIAYLTGIPRQEVYGLLLGLRQLGLVRQNLTVPATYTAAPFVEAAKILFEQRANELTLISKRAKRLTGKIDQIPRLAVTQVPPRLCFGAVAEGERGRKYQAAIEQTQRTIDAVISWGRFRQLCFHFETELKDALKRGVAFRFLAEKPPNHHLARWVKGALGKYANFELKITPNQPEAAITVFDDREVAVAFNPSVRLTKGPELWTTHGGLVVVCQRYFASCWAVVE